MVKCYKLIYRCKHGGRVVLFGKVVNHMDVIKYIESGDCYYCVRRFEGKDQHWLLLDKIIGFIRLFRPHARKLTF
jgi:cyclophilin family peptidyl-prolyl cis-trans isomerase